MIAWARTHRGTLLTVAGLLIGLVGLLYAAGVFRPFQQGPASTDVQSVRLFTIDGLSDDVRVEQQVAGECEPGAATSRDSQALHCFMLEGGPLDPCWPSPTGDLVVCPESPWAPAAIVLDPVVIATPEPAAGAATTPPTTVQNPWAVELVLSSEQRVRCVALSSWAGERDGMRRNYYCFTPTNPNAGAAIGDVDQSTDLWTILYEPWLDGKPSADDLVEVPVVVAHR